MKNALGQIVPALLGVTRIRIAPSIGLGRHRPWAAPNGKRPKRGALFLAALALTGCATTQTRYSPVYCVTNVQLEELKKQEPGKVHDKLTGDASRDVGILAGNAIRLRAYADGLLVVLGGCTGSEQPLPKTSLWQRLTKPVVRL